ncbi:MAG: glucodextranase DOMON-like domain-containing protein [Spirochaetota bacterium]
MKLRSAISGIVLLAGVLVGLASCVTPAGRRAMSEDVLYVNLVWHQHQPLYYQDPDTGVYSRPWVRVHATKSYYDMAAILREYPDVRATFNLTPVLLRQLEDFENGATDRYWVLAEKHPSELTNEEKQFILERFFDANHENMIGKFPRYTELLQRREEIDTRTVEGINSFSEQDYLDLQVFFNLVWFDPMFLEREPLASLVAKGGDFAQEDKAVLFEEARRIIGEVVPVHRELQDAGQIEVITTPYAHPILPLIFSTNLAAEGDPTAELPNEYYYPNDAVAHLERSVEIYREKFGRDPVGLWPAEGAVAQEIVNMVAESGYRWMATGEQVLAKSLGLDGFVRDENDTVVEADALYRPYIVQAARSEPVAIVFRDLRISDLIGFEYSGTPGETAAADLMQRLERIRQRLQEETGGEGGPHLVSIILDGENAWEHYPNDGKEFLNALYRNLSESQTIRTTTVTEFMDAFPEQRRIDDLWPGSWFSSDYSTWIGEREETKAWNLLGRVREFLALYDMRGRRETTPEQLAEALDYMYLAEGSDWFWWYGADQDSGQDEYFDEAYRELLANVFRALDEPVPDYVRVPIIPERPEAPARRPSGTFTPTVDGSIGDDEWASGGYYRNVGDAQARGTDVLDGLRYGFDTERFHVALETSTPVSEALARGSVQLYFGYPGQVATAPFVDAAGGELVGFDSGLYLDIARDGVTVVRRTMDGAWEATTEEIDFVYGARTIEASVPLSLFGDLESGDEVSFAAYSVEASGVFDRLPSSGPGRSNVPDLGGGELVLAVEDPVGDDTGPGSYTYPTDSVFAPGSFDVTEFIVEEEENYLKFTVGLNAPIQNPWGSGINLSLQTVDIYLDIDPGAGTGARRLLEGRNAALPADFGWEYALWVEGWNQKVLVPEDPDDPASAPVELSGSPLRVRVDADAGRIVIRLPREMLPDGSDPTAFGYTVAVLGQEGFPSAGVRRVRNVEESAGQWVLGGAPDDVNHTRIVDMVVPAGASVTQQELLSDYPPVASGSAARLAPDELPRAYVNAVE